MNTCKFKGCYTLPANGEWCREHKECMTEIVLETVKNITGRTKVVCTESEYGIMLEDDTMFLFEDVYYRLQYYPSSLFYRWVKQQVETTNIESEPDRVFVFTTSHSGDTAFVIAKTLAEAVAKFNETHKDVEPLRVEMASGEVIL